MNNAAIYYEPSAFHLRGKVMGRQSAGAAFMQAVADARPNRVWCYASARVHAQDCAQTLTELGAPRTGVTWIPFSQPQHLAEPGLLYRPDPGIHADAWRRLTHARPDAYSLCGITHTTASHAVMDVLADLPTAPLQGWDALICTSRSVRDSVQMLVENRIEYLRERTGATRFALPQLPLIPLGVHCERFASTSDKRQNARLKLGIEPDEVVVLFTGRLSFHGKAHPLPMYLGLEANAKTAKIVLLQAGWFAHESIEKAFQADAAALCPSVRCIYVDGRNQDNMKQAYAASDIFTSLSDNIQETFGITPIEAMAAGLPVVVSDWDGYRDTVRDGIDGFRVPTLTLPPGTKLGSDLADRFDMGIDDYDRYCAYTSQLVSVDVEAATQAYRRLIVDPGLRAKMGQAGAARSREVFSWSVIFRDYQRLWDELAERRRADARLAPALTPRRRSERADPFAMFASYPTEHVGPGASFRRHEGIDLAAALSRLELASTSFAKSILPAPALIEALLTALEGDWMPFDVLVRAVPDVSPEALASAVVWLSKAGVLDFHKQP
ncbi:glycosyltransferase family 4 protein [Methylobacterium gregans]|uniref:D-inositol-3-phosphate glycosyltransferase n=1 Tax=Methylobacterium gregans TaxID=374424 RepID=A0AA37HMT3_9HYPH|nr:glycosyltransferase family 4 protein [Methylobacterium gregans]MDQ0521922.1 glycosyltransferase involved in cell wall biosynthesis [Methylobacterium gregans]GJD78043.1 D-inositol-3-phosphate glycosyltransferase [Methylobacterium gregans]GLS52012.1 hypothetical protein GCM10007886_01940 [Methylobacterium gregans]